MRALKNYRTEPLTGRYDAIKTQHSKDIIEYLTDLLSHNIRLLEIGPGHGHFARAAIAAGFDYDAIEPSDYFREPLRQAGLDVTGETVPPIDRPSNQYDLVYGSMFIENLPTSKEAGEFACDAFKILKPGGHLVLIFPNFLTWGSFFFDEHYTHSFETTPRRVHHLLTSQGFDILKTEHLLGWFWIRESLLRNLLRHTVNVAMWFVHLPLTRWLSTYAGLSEVHWKVRKTFFESILIVAKKPPSA